MSSDKVDTNDTDTTGNTKSVASYKGRARLWSFTLNNYTKNDIETLTQLFNDEWKCEYCFQEEEGKKEKTPHLQGMIYLKNARTWNSITQFNPKIHWEKGRHSKKVLVRYCSKIETAISELYTNMELEREEDSDVEDDLENVKLYPWQQKIIDICNTKPDKRKIYWFWEPNGKVGKSSLARHIELNFKRVMLLGGAGKDMKYAISELIKNGGKYPKIILINLVRTQEERISWTGIEEIKDAHFFSSKFKSGSVLRNRPHLFIFANFVPNTDVMSTDRWEITEIKKED